jgi:hypothetical protein
MGVFLESTAILNGRVEPAKTCRAPPHLGSLHQLEDLKSFILFGMGKISSARKGLR